MPLVVSKSKGPMFVRAKPSARPNLYATQLERHRPRQIDPYSFPTGGLAGLAELGDTGIPAVDAIVAQAQKKIDRLVLATEVGTVCSVIGALAGLFILFRGSGR